MKILSKIILLLSLLLAGCSTVYLVKKASVESILAHGEDAHLKRFQIEGYAVSAFEHRALYGNLKDAEEQNSKKGIWLGGGGLLGSFDPFGTTTTIWKVKIEGTILSQKTWMHEEIGGGGFGHMGACSAEVVDIIILEKDLISKESERTRQ